MVPLFEFNQVIKYTPKFNTLIRMLLATRTVLQHEMYTSDHCLNRRYGRALRVNIGFTEETGRNAKCLITGAPLNKGLTSEKCILDLFRKKTLKIPS